MEKFKCVECDVNEVDEEGDMCDDCAEAYNGSMCASAAGTQS